MLDRAASAPQVTSLRAQLAESAVRGAALSRDKAHLSTHIDALTLSRIGSVAPAPMDGPPSPGRLPRCAFFLP